MLSPKNRIFMFYYFIVILLAFALIVILYSGVYECETKIQQKENKSKQNVCCQDLIIFKCSSCIGTGTQILATVVSEMSKKDV